MVKAHSLLYAVYICLIISIICGALLYFSNLFGQLNLHYNLHEELYTHNQSVVNFALGHQTKQHEIPDDGSGISGSYVTKPYGVLGLLLARSTVGNDTLSAVYFTGQATTGKTALYVPALSKPMSYFGIVKIKGEIYLPTQSLKPFYNANTKNELTLNKEIVVSDHSLPELHPVFFKIFEGIPAIKTALVQLEKTGDSIYYNSFLNDSKEIYLPAPVLGNIVIKGNFILRAKDSIRVKKNAILEDVILMAPKITFEEGFSGTVQAFATEGIELEETVDLKYPSVLCVNNSGSGAAKIRIKKDCKIMGGIVLFGNSQENIDKNIIDTDEGLIVGDIYCTGKIKLQCKTLGSVYAERFFSTTLSGIYENMMSNVAIDAVARPDYFIGIPLFDAKKSAYGILKKVL